MMKRIMIPTLLAIVAGTALATETVIFENDMPGGTWGFGTNSAAIQTQSWTSADGNVSMDLILTAQNGEVVANGDEISLRITSTNTNANANRIDSAQTADALDDETLTLQLNVAVSGGATVTNIYMKNLSFNSFGTSDSVEFGDGSATFATNGATGDTFDYLGTNVALTGLTPLSPANAGGLGDGSWQLSLTARDGLQNGTGTVVRTEFQFEDITIVFDRAENVAPVVTTKSVSGKFGNVRTVVLNGYDPDNAPSNLTFSIVSGTSNGSLGSVYDGNKVDYTPNPGFDGSDSFDFAASDGDLSATGTITIVVAENVAPVADDQDQDAVSTVPLAVTLTGSDNEGQDLTYAILDGPTNGALSGTAPAMTYTSDEGYTGADSFTFTVTDTEGLSSTGTVSITVTPNYKYVRFEEDMPGGVWPSDILDGVNKSYTAVVTKENITFSLTMEALDMSGEVDQGTAKLDSNNSGITIGIVGAGGTKNHRIESNGSNNEGVKFTLSVSPQSGYILDELFLDNLELNTWDPADTADFSDGTTTTNIGTTDTAYDFHNYTGNDTDRGDTGVVNMSDWGLVPLSLATVGGEGDGTWELSLVAVGDPTDFAIENIDFGFVVNALVNNPPVADSQSLSVEANDSLDITLSASDAEPLTFAILAAPANGSLSTLGNLTGSSADTTYTPNLNYTGSDSFTFTATDGELSSTGTVSISVSPDYLVAGFGERYVNGFDADFADNPSIDYGQLWPDGVDDLGSIFTHSVTDTVNDIIFSVTLTSESGNTIASQNSDEDIGIFGGGNNYRIDAGEGAIKATVNVSGDGAALLNTLELERFYVRRWGNGEIAVLSDGISSINIARADTGTTRDYLEYTGNLNPAYNLGTLTALNKDNTDTWSLSLNSDGSSQIGIGAIGFRYTIKLGHTTYGLWAVDYPGIGGPNDDTGDNDGMDNLLEYALGGNPTADDAAEKLPKIESDENWFYYIHHERANDDSLAYTVEQRDSLTYGSWTNGSPFIEVDGESEVVNDFKSVTNRTDIGSAEFLRLKVEQN